MLKKRKDQTTQAFFDSLAELRERLAHIEEKIDNDGKEYRERLSHIEEKSNFGTGTIVRRLEKEGIIIDPEWKDKWLSNVVVSFYSLLFVKISDLYCAIYNGEKWERRPLSEHPVVQYYLGDEKPYLDYLEILRKNNLDDIHSLEKVEELEQKLSKEDYNHNYAIFIDENNTILDGSHRAAWLFNKYGPELTINAVVISGNFTPLV